MPRGRVVFGLLVLAAALLPCAVGAQEAQGDPRLTEVWEPVPPQVTAGEGTAPPSDALVLFDGQDLSGWRHDDGRAAEWRVADGAVTVVKGTGNLETRRSFADCQLHVEWRSPEVVEGEGQGRGNSGVFLQGRYEVQVLDSYESRTYSNGQAGSIYKQHIPLVNACRPPGEWQTYDIVFEAPYFNEDGSVRRPAHVTVLHNGVLIQNHVELRGATAYIGAPRYERHGLAQPLMLQDHGNPVSYRNIWIRELKLPEAE